MTIRTVVVYAAMVVWTLIAAVPVYGQCSFTIDPASASYTAAGGDGQVAIRSSDPGCPRTATSNVSWLTISFGSPGTGDGSAGYHVDANPTAASRTGTMTIAGQTFTVTQAAASCSFVLTPKSFAADPNGDTGTIAVSSNCSWTATATVAWILITSPAANTGNGSISFSVQANTGTAARSATITVGTQTFAITQGAGTCTQLTLQNTSAAFTSSGGTGGIVFSTPCNWVATTTASWITLAAPVGGMGNGTLSYSVAPNTTLSARTGTITILNQTFTVSQAAGCTITLNGPGAAYAAQGGTGSVTVTASNTSCDRSASSDSAWITITSGAVGTGNGTVGYSVAVNGTTNPRTGTITIGGVPFYITEAPNVCTYALTPASASVGTDAAVGTFQLTTACDWTASTIADWISLVGAASGTGNASIAYVIAANGTGRARTGTISIGNQGFAIYQAGGSCPVQIDPTSVSVPAAGQLGSVSVMAADPCNWNVAAAVSWITLVTGSAGVGQGTVQYQVAPNSDAKPRTGAITIGNKTFSVSQAGFVCNITLASTSFSAAAQGGSGSVDIAAGCPWTATSNAPWVQLTSAASGSADATISFTLAANTSGKSRTGSITIGGQTFTITQSGMPCAVTLSAASGQVPATGGSGSVSVTSGAGCTWTPVASDPWLKLTWSIVSGSGTVNYSAAASTSAASRTATIAIADQTYTVTQPGITISLVAAGVTNGASFLSGPVAPGELVTIFGSGFGPASIATAQLTDDKKALASIVGETRVLFDGVASPMIYAVAGQVSAIVPYEIAGQTTTNVQVEYRGVASDPLGLDVVPATPAIFTADRTGHGPGIILNQNNAVNSATAPAAKNSVITLYATGGGETEPASTTGQIAGAPLPHMKLPVSVQIGTITAAVTYAGPAPGIVSGVLQINVRVPQSAPSGNAVPIALKIGTATSPPGVTIAIR